MAQSSTDHKSGTSSAARSHSTFSSPKPRPPRRLRRLAELEAGDRNPETAGASQIGAAAEHQDGGAAGTNGLGDDDLLMDEKDQIAFDEKLAQDIFDAESKEAEQRVHRAKQTEALARRLAARAKAKSPATELADRFVPLIRSSQVDGAEFHRLCKDPTKVVYGFRDAVKDSLFEVFWIERERVEVTVAIDPTKVAACTQALLSADAVIGSIKFSLGAAQTSPIATPVVSPALAPLREQTSPQPPKAPRIPRPRTLPDFMEPLEPFELQAKKKKKESASTKPSLKRPPSMGVGGTMSSRDPKKKKKVIEVDMDTEEKELEEEVIDVTQPTAWSLSPTE